MNTDIFTTDDLDAYNFRSEIRDTGRDFLDGDIEPRTKDERVFHQLIAHYANLLLEDYIAFDGKVTTTQHDEAVIITQPHSRNPAYRESFLVRRREDMHYAPEARREWLNEFRDTITRYVLEVATEAFEIAEQQHHHEADTAPRV